MLEWLPFLAVLAIAAPFAAALGVGIVSFLARVPAESTSHRIVLGALTTSAVALGALAAFTALSGRPHLEIELGPWFRVGHYEFELAFLLDELSLGFGLVVAIVGILIGRFAVHYLHRESGHARFFGFLGLAVAGLEVVALAASYDILFLGWEIVGVSSVAMVLFFHTRPGPVRAAMQVLASYRIADLGLLLGAVVLHDAAGTTRYEAVFEHGAWPRGATHIDVSAATIVAALLVLSASGKSAQLPFSAWLPRAMEGPTPSSALFYGALSIHAGVFLLLRSAPLFEHAPVARFVLLAVGGATALYAALTGRVQSDAKGQMAFATMAQVGVMFVEIGLGFTTLAALHLVAHAFLRGFQLLRTPSVITDVRRIQAELRGRPLPQENAIERSLPLPVAQRLYRLALERFHLDSLAQRLVIGPVMRASGLLAAADDALVEVLSGGAGTSDGAPRSPHETSLPAGSPPGDETLRVGGGGA
jgi:NADH:ubiquinone oxidoreductase subunit 5 (subunit L)/multisubunit Na+/H+ antiporter MnhA subunit